MNDSDQVLSDDELQAFLDSVGVDSKSSTSSKEEIQIDNFLNEVSRLPPIEPTRYVRVPSPTLKHKFLTLWICVGIISAFALGIGFGFLLGERTYSQYSRYQGLVERLESLSEQIPPLVVEFQMGEQECIESTDPIPPLSEKEQLAPKQPA